MASKIAQGTSSNFPLMLSTLRQSDGHIQYVIHATFRSGYNFGLQPSVFFAEMGFNRYEDHCMFFPDSECFYIVIAEVHSLLGRPQNIVAGRNVKEDFLAFAEHIDRLFELRLEEERILQKIGLKASGKYMFGRPVQIQIDEKDIPLWVDEVKFSHLQELEVRKDEITKEIDKLIRFLPLLYSTGALLEDAVVHAFQALGMEAERTEKAATIDVVAQTLDGSRMFGVEVTGIDGAVKKDSKKVVQLMTFQTQKEHGEKAILIANTYRDLPISERRGKEHFTQQALNTLQLLSVLTMTGWDLYCMVNDMLEGSQSREQLIEILYTTSGLLHYGS